MNVVSRAAVKAYEQIRGVPLPPDTPPSVLFGLMFRKSGDLARGWLLSRWYGHRGASHFRGRRTSVRNAHQLSIGRSVVFDSDIIIDAYSDDGVCFGDGVTVGAGSSLLGSAVIRERGAGISVGAHTAIGLRNVVWGQGGVEIGDDCLLGPDVVIISENHGTSDLDELIRLQPAVRARIVIGDNCWIGAGAKILAGVEIGSGSIVGAGAVVVGPVPPNSIAVGVPARVVRSRS